MIEKQELKKQIQLLNQLFEIEKKVTKLNEKNSINRNINKLKDFFKNDFNGNFSLIIENPIDESYRETRTDVEASISGDSVEDLIIIEVIKPIIRLKHGINNQIIQKGIVIVQDERTIKKEENIVIKKVEEVKKKSSNSTNKSKRRLKKELKKRKGKR